MSEPLRLADDDRRLLEENRRLGQQLAALMRGVLAALPRPTPPGDWGRPNVALEATRQRVVGAATASAAPSPEPAAETPPTPPLRLVRPRAGIGGNPLGVKWPPDEKMRRLYDKHGGSIAALAQELDRSYMRVYAYCRDHLGLRGHGHRGRRQTARG